MASSHSQCLTIDSPKIMRKGHLLLGLTGTIRDLELIRNSFTMPKHKKGVGPRKYLATSFVEKLRKLLKDYGAAAIDNNSEGFSSNLLITYKKQLVNIDSGYGLLSNLQNFMASGSGQSSAEAVMSVLKPRINDPVLILLEALQEAARITPWVGAPFDIIGMNSEGRVFLKKTYSSVKDYKKRQ